MICDLHTHSVYSDGTYTPKELIEEAKKLNICAIALTDHNTVAGVPEFIEEANKQGVIGVAGVELSTAYQNIEFHLLGLFIDSKHYKDVERLAKEFHVLKEISNIETIERLNDAGYNISYADVRRKNPTGNVNRAHIAAELLKQGYVNSINEAFDTILGDDKGFYVAPKRLELLDAIEFLNEINALPILAHPLKDADEATLRELLPSAIEKGLVGLETYHSSYDDKTINLAKELTKQFQILESGGSDFHGKNKPGIHLGTGTGNLNISIDIYEKLLSKFNTINK